MFRVFTTAHYGSPYDSIGTGHSIKSNQVHFQATEIHRDKKEEKLQLYKKLRTAIDCMHNMIVKNVTSALCKTVLKLGSFNSNSILVTLLYFA